MLRFNFPIVIIDEDFRSENTSGLGIRALAAAIEKETKHDVILDLQLPRAIWRHEDVGPLKRRDSAV